MIKRVMIRLKGFSDKYLCFSRFSRDIFGFDRFLIHFSLFLIVFFSLSCQPSTNAEENSTPENEFRRAKNEAVLVQAQNDIEKYRKGNVRIKILGSNGKTVFGAKLKIKQSSHDFKFGCYLKIDDLDAEKLPEYEKHFARLFNYAVVGTYWDFIENKQGIENWHWFEREIAIGKKLGLKIEAAPVLWGTNKAGTPQWLPKDKKELLEILERRVKTAVSKNDESVDEWEIVNEPLAPKTDVFARRIGNDYIESAFLWARQAAPNKRLLINEYGVFGSVSSHNRNRDTYFNLLSELLKKPVSPDVIGIQAHANGEWYEPADIAEQLKRYASLGKPIQITEFSSQIYDFDDRTTPLKITGNYQSGVWNAEKQAEFYREFYTVSFANPQVEAITTWGLDDERAWLPGIGLIDENDNEKPNYKVLDRLINEEWRTNLQMKIGKSGIGNFRGFYGVYEVEAVVNGKTIVNVFELKKIAENEWIIKI